MRLIFLVAVSLILGITATAQHTFKAKIINKETGEPMIGATVSIETLQKTAVADSVGFVAIKNIPNGSFLVTVSSVGFLQQQNGIWDFVAQPLLSIAERVAKVLQVLLFMLEALVV